MLYVYFVGDKTYWSDRDHSKLDKTPYYPAPAGVEVGTRCRLVNGKAVADPSSQIDLEEIRQIENKNRYTNKLINKLEKHKNTLIQTIPAHIRTAILGSEKQNPKTYTDTWQNFYQRCQNIRFDPDIIHELKAREAATWVVKRIEKISIQARKIKEQIKEMTIDELLEYDVTDWGIDE